MLQPDDGLSALPDEPLSRHLALRTGGPCEAWVVAHSLPALARVMADCRAASWTWRMLGAGTRTVARRGGLRGAVVRLGTGFAGIRRDDEGWTVGAAVPVPALVAQAEASGFGGLSAVALVPGSVGASVLLDDGWSDVIRGVYVLYRGREREVEPAAARKGSKVVTGVRLELPPLDSAERRRLVRTRSHGLPVPPGSVYRPLRRRSVRQVLRTAALERVRLRGIAIPAEAPELLVNLGGGTAADAKLLQRSAIERVRKIRGIELEDRLNWIGGR